MPSTKPSNGRYGNKAIPGVGTGRRIPGVRSRKIPGQPKNFPGRARGQRVRLRDLRGQFIEGGVGFQWVGLEFLIENCMTRGDAVYDTLLEAAREVIPEMVAYGQRNASWEDRTGAARAGLKGTVLAQQETDSVTVFFGHGVFYGVYLELMDFGSYQIVPQTIAWGRQEIMNRTASKNPLGRNLA